MWLPFLQIALCSPCLWTRKTKEQSSVGAYMLSFIVYSKIHLVTLEKLYRFIPAEAPHPLVRLKWEQLCHFNKERPGIPLLLYANTHLFSYVGKGFSYRANDNQLLLLLNYSQYVSIQFYLIMNWSYYRGEKPCWISVLSCLFLMTRM